MRLAGNGVAKVFRAPRDRILIHVGVNCFHCFSFDVLGRGKIREALVSEWPRLAGTTALIERTLDEVEMSADDLVVSIHACGALTDRIIARAVAAHARLAVLPCCHDFASCDSGALTGWMDAPLAIDVTRAVRLQQQGYRVWTQEIPPDITSKNRLLIAAPIDSPNTLTSVTIEAQNRSQI